MNNKKRVAMGYVFLLPALILFMVVVAYPVFNTLKTSFYSIRVQNIATGGKWVGLANYKQLFIFRLIMLATQCILCAI